MKEDKVEEYNSLRQEILQKDAQYNEYRKNIPAITSAVLAFALTQQEPFICLVPIIIIIPMYLISEECLRMIYKLGTYIMVFYEEEGFHWETRNMNFVSHMKYKNDKKTIFLSNALIYLALISICCILCIYKIITNRYSYYSNTLIRCIVVLIVFVLSSMIVITKKVYAVDVRKVFKSQWIDIKKGEARQNSKKRK